MESKFKRGVSLMHRFNNSLWYSVECSCGSKECNTKIEVELDEHGFILLHFYRDVDFNHWKYDNMLFNFLYRCKEAIKLIFTGHLTSSSDFVLTDEEHIKNFAEAILEGRQYCLDVKERENEK